VLVVGGVWHDFDYARLELLKLLAEHDEFRVRVQPDYEDTSPFEPGGTFPAEILVTYTCDVRPSERAQRALREWVEAGGRWVALHGTSSALDQSADGWVAPDSMPLFVDTLGSQFVAHPPIRPYTVTNAAPDHWLVAGVEPFEATDELYLNRYPDRSALTPLLQTTYQGDARGFAEGDWNDCDPDHLVMYLRPLGDGAVLYNTLGHCRGHWDMTFFGVDYYPIIERGSWEIPQYYELLRRGFAWALDADREAADA
jgi:type 1 glutamine amidotransferase